ncbi:hypothetical protein ACF3DV_32670 [Chlorogloeopsis fritschii PCC 9212]|uniref:hypothetical protein n=1 Tax=Chlorogloeopsis fritschii TaxID=1124 RepID=UPI000F8F7D5E|nr:hypothetical protein [Chlorogloeopsis fritschii]
MAKPLPRRDISRLYTSNSYRDSATPKIRYFLKSLTAHLRNFCKRYSNPFYQKDRRCEDMAIASPE